MNDLPKTTPPRPEPPIAPDPAQCCGSGCDPCIWDFYHAEMATYRRELAEWEKQYQNGTPVDVLHADDTQ